MPPDGDASIPDDRLRLQHMLDAASAAQRIAAGRSRPDLDNDETLLRALMHCFMEIGEAAARISDGGRARISDLPWGQIVHVRHIVVHVYWGVDRDRLWQAIGEDLPPLIIAIETRSRLGPRASTVHDLVSEHVIVELVLFRRGPLPGLPRLPIKRLRQPADA